MLVLKFAAKVCGI